MPNDIIYGRNSVLEALLAGQRRIFRLLIGESSKNNKIEQIKMVALRRGIEVRSCDQRHLDTLCGTGGHQGVVALVEKRREVGLSDLFDLAKERNEAPFFLVLDRIVDPRNLGAIIRTAEAAGVHGLILSRHESCDLTPTVAKASAGAIEYMPIVQVSNLANLAEQLKKNGVWLFGADPMGEPYWQGSDFTLPLALVLGSEGKGLKNILKKKCDFLISIPMKGFISSLNVAVAGAIFMYEVVKQRNL